MNVTERNHYLPQFYLEAFGTGTKQPLFWVYDKQTLKSRQQSPINTGVEKNLYNIEKADGSIDDFIEREVFSKVDDFPVEAVRLLLPNDARLLDKDIEKVSMFLAFMATRVPRSIQVTKEIGSAVEEFKLFQLSKKPKEIKKALSELQEQGKLSKDLTFEQIQKILSSQDKHFKVIENEKIAMAMSIFVTEAIHKQLLGMKWCLCRAPSGIEFITGDAPLVCFVLEPNGQAIFGGGYASQEAEVTLPLSPNKCLYLDHKHNQRYRAVSKKVVKEINKRTAWAAERFIIARYKSKYVDELLKWGSKSLEYPKMDTKELYSEFENIGLFD